MKTLVWAVCSLAAIATVAGAAEPRAVRPRLQPPGRPDCPAPWCETVPTIHSLVAPDDPAQYLGDAIAYERPSDWRDFAPLRDEVAELTQGLTSDLDRATAIADWVKHSKVSAPHAYTTWPPSIVDIWGFPDGQCEEASLLAAAMLRLAGIPAGRFVTWSGEHAAVRAWVDGRWVVVDATPTTPDNSGPARVYGPDDPSLVPGYQERPLLTLHNVPLPGSGPTVAALTLFSHEPFRADAQLSPTGLDYGKVAFPVTNEFLYYDAGSRQFVAAGEGGQRVEILYHIDARDGSCLDKRRSWFADPVAFLVPGFLWRTIDPTQPPAVGSFYPLGYLETILPTCGTWRITYYLSAGALDAAPQALAYEDFDLAGADDEVVIRPRSLQPEPGADMYCFQALVGTLEKLPTFEQLGGVASE